MNEMPNTTGTGTTTDTGAGSTQGTGASANMGGAGTPPKQERTWTEEVEVAGNELVDRVKKLVQEGNVRRLIIRNKEGRSLLEIPLTAGVAVGGVLTFFYPVLAAVGAFAALLAEVKIEIIRSDSMQ